MHDPSDPPSGPDGPLSSLPPQQPSSLDPRLPPRLPPSHPPDPASVSTRLDPEVLRERLNHLYLVRNVSLRTIAVEGQFADSELSAFRNKSRWGSKRLERLAAALDRIEARLPPLPAPAAAVVTPPPDPTPTAVTDPPHEGPETMPAPSPFPDETTHDDEPPDLAAVMGDPTDEH